MRDLAAGLVLVEGENEAGKSTLLAFLRAMLFGFARRPAPRGEPLRGGRHGGALRVVTRAGECYRLERYGDGRAPSEGLLTVRREADGNPAALTEITRADRETFHNIFALGLTELQSISTLEQGDLQNRLYAAGSGLGAVSAADVAKELDRQARAIFVPGGRTTTWATLARQLEDTSRRIRELQRGLAEYEEGSADLARVEQEVATAHAQVQADSTEHQRLQRLREAWPSWVKLQTAERELADLPDAPAFPSDGQARLEALLTQRDDRQQALREQTQERDLLARQLADVVVDEGLPEHEGEISDLYAELSRVRGAIGDLPRRHAEAAEQARQVQSALDRTGQGWDRAQAEAFDTSVPVRDQIRQREQAVRRAHEAEQQARGDLTHAEEVLAEARREIEAKGGAVEVDAAAEPGEEEERQLRVREEAAQRAAEALAERRTQLALQPQLEERRADQQERAAAARERASRVRPRVPLWSGLAAAGLAIVLAVIIWSSSPPAGVVLLVLALGGLLFSYYLHQETESRRAEAEQAAREAERGAAEAARGLEDLGAKLRHLEEWLRAESATLGQPIGGPRDLEEVQRALRDFGARVKGVREAANRVQRAQSALATALTRAEQATATREAEQRTWETWVRERGLRLPMTPEGALELLSLLENLQQMLRALDQAEHRVQAICEDIAAVRRRAEAVLEACGRAAPVEDAELPAAIEALATDLRHATAARDQREQLRRAVLENQSRRQGAERRLGEAESALAQLLAAGGADDVEGFRRRAALHAARQALEQRLAEERRALMVLGGTGADYEGFVRELQAVSPAELQQQAESAAEALLAATAAEAELHKRQGELRERLRGLEVNEELSAALLQEAALQAELAEEARRWAERVVCRHLLARACETYERERQPRVLQEASRLFAQITAGRYVRVVQPLGERRYEVEGGDGKRLPVEHLSRGTLEQLALCIRLGYIEEYARHEDPLPLVLDDVSANFDPRRAQATASLLAHFAQRHQVLFLTCHPEWADRFQASGAPVQRLHLEDGRIEQVA